MRPRSLADPHASTPAELKARLAAERRGAPFVLYRDAAGDQVIVELDASAAHVTVGRRSDNDVALGWDAEVSRVHAQLEPVGGDWTVVDDGLSRNGSFVNGQRIAGRRRLRDGDRLCFGETPVLFCAPANEASLSTAAVGAGPAAIQLTDRAARRARRPLPADEGLRLRGACEQPRDRRGGPPQRRRGEGAPAG